MSVAVRSRRLANLAFILLSLGFPFLILFSAGRWGPWPAILLLAAVMLVRLYLGRLNSGRGSGLHGVLPAQAAAVGGVTVIGLVDADLAARLYPVLVNAMLLAIFATSLVRPPSIIERLARITEPDLPPHAVIYTRQVTRVWCVFFTVNGGIALATVFLFDRTVWAVYNGVIAYIAAGCLFGAEYLVRRRVRAAGG